MSKKDDVTKLLERLVCTHGDSAPVREVTALVTSLVEGHSALRAKIAELEGKVSGLGADLGDVTKRLIASDNSATSAEARVEKMRDFLEEIAQAALKTTG